MIRALPAPSTWDRWQWYRLANLAALGGVVFMAVGIAMTGYRMDAYAYWWGAHLPPDLYARGWNTPTVNFVYSPAAAQSLAPLAVLPYGAFYALVVAAETAALVWLTGPLLALVGIAFVQPVQDEILTGNIHLLLAAAVVGGFRYPALWSTVLLTKVVPGVGLVWFAVRREWRALAIALGVTAVIAAVSFLLAPHLWGEWIARLAASSGIAPVPLGPRLVIGAALVAYGATRDWYWTVPFAAALAMPNFGPGSLALAAFAGVVPFITRAGRWTAPTP